MSEQAPRKVRASAAPKGVGNRGKGRVKGTPNKVTKALKEMILGALDEAGGQEYLAKQAKESPAAFLTLLGKVLPSEIKADVDATLSGKVDHTHKPDLSGLTDEQLRALASIPR